MKKEFKNENVSLPGMQTLLAHYGENHSQGAVVSPIFQNTLFTYPTFEAFKEASGSPDHYFYSRISNPTLAVVEKKLAMLENGEAAKLFASGMAAISAVLFHFLKQGDHVICSRPIYGGTYEMLQNYLRKYGVEVDFIDFKNPDTVRSAIRKNTKMLYSESYATMFMDTYPIREVAELAKEYGIVSVMDNTCGTPYTFRPLNFGIDVVIHSASKFLCGHSDVVAGAVIASKEIVSSIINTELALIGASLPPMEAWLLSRGLKTFGIRMAYQSKSALRIAEALAEHPKVRRVNQPLLPGHEQHELARSQFMEATPLFSIELVGGLESAARMMNALKYFGIGVSWGGFESLIYSPGLGWQDQQVKGTPYESRVSHLLRLSIGLEDTEDLLQDLLQALEEA